MLPTPETQHIEGLPVYPPDGDSFLLLDTFGAESDFLKARFPPNVPLVVTEIGTGSGVVIAFLTAHARTIFGREQLALFAFDINRYACQASQITTQHAVQQVGAPSAQFLGSHVADITTAIRAKSVDIVMFNPPYVPSDQLPSPVIVEDTSKKADFETESRLFDLAVSGGLDGMVTTWRLLNQLDRILSDRGVAYVLLCARNKPKDVMLSLRSDGWAVENVRSSGKTGGVEKLCVIRISR